MQVDEDHGTTENRLPGRFNGLFATRKMVVPYSWSKSHVFLRVRWENQAPGHLAVNGKVLFYDTPTPSYMDVTPWIKFGQPNRFLIQSAKAMQSWEPGQVIIQSAILERVPHT